jgi:hypothetical protein
MKRGRILDVDIGWARRWLESVRRRAIGPERRASPQGRPSWIRMRSRRSGTAKGPIRGDCSDQPRGPQERVAWALSSQLLRPCSFRGGYDDERMLVLLFTGTYLAILLALVRSLRIAGEKRHALGIRHRVLDYARPRRQDF